MLVSWSIGSVQSLIGGVRLPLRHGFCRALTARSKNAKAELPSGKTLVIVESPAKAKTIQKFLDSQGDDYIVDSCAGHIRDISRNMVDGRLVHPGLRLKVSDLGIDVFNAFSPCYSLLDRKKDIVDRLKKSSAAASRIYLATDEDREGEAISWHLIEVLKPTIPFQVSLLIIVC